jgi:MFS family permease
MKKTEFRRFMALLGCVLGNIVDGFDILAVAYTGSAIMGAWRLDPATLGMIFSAGLFGMTLGSLLIAPFADRYGRRTVTLACLFTMAAGMLACGAAQNATQLIVLRFVTGLGIGGVMATLVTVVAEIASERRRNLTMALFSMGYPLGATLGGVVAMLLIGRFGWQSVFVLGGVLTFVVFGLNYLYLPESLTTRAPGTMRSRYTQDLFGSSRFFTLAMCLAFFLNMLSFFFINNWTPKLTEALGLDAQVGIVTGVLLSAGSLAGSLSFGFMADRFGLNVTAKCYFLCFGVLIAAFSIIGPQAIQLYALALATGLFMSGAMTSLYSIAPLVFEPKVRASGIGLAIGVGRLGATLGPLLAGFALNFGLERALIYLLYALPPLLVVALISPLLRRRTAPVVESFS